MSDRGYLLFAGQDCYAGGGWFDFIGGFATLEEAKNKAQEVMAAKKYCEVRWYHIVHDGKIVDESEEGAVGSRFNRDPYA